MSLSDAAARLAEAIEQVAGIATPPARRGSLVRVAEERARARGVSGVEAYVHRLLAGALPGEWPRLLSAVTVKESYCFRGAAQLEAFARRVIPEIAAARTGSRTVRVWSAGCARGEEPATVAILLAEHLGLSGWDWKVYATDIDREALEAARSWRFPERALRETPPGVRDRYFRREGDRYLLDPRLAARIELGEMNLVAEPFRPPTTDLDAIFLRNVLIYFRPASQRRVVRSMARCLAPHGRLVLGPAEVLWHRCEELEVEDLGNAFFYRRRAGAWPRAGAPPAHSAHRTEADATPPRRAERAVSAREGGGGGDPVDVAVEALAAGELTVAERALGEAGGPGTLDPSLHALRGLLAEAEGDPDGALAAYRAALYLEPRLFQVRLLLAETLLAAGSPERARHELLRVLEDARAGIELPWSGRLALPDRDRAARRARRLLAG